MKKSQTSQAKKNHTVEMGIHQTAPNALLYAVAGTDTHAGIQVFPDVRHSLGFQGLQSAAGIMGSEWVGVENFVQFIDSPNFGILLENTLKISIYGLILGFFPPILLALSLNHLISTKWKKRFQLILYAPNFISLVIVVGMLFMFLAADGPINGFIETITGSRITFMTDPNYFRTLYILSGIWQGMGWASVLYTATLANVSQDLIDAAHMDGANILYRIWYIDLPAIAPDHGHPVHPFCRGDHECRLRESFPDADIDEPACFGNHLDLRLQSRVCRWGITDIQRQSGYSIQSSMSSCCWP